MPKTFNDTNERLLPKWCAKKSWNQLVKVEEDWHNRERALCEMVISK